VNGGRSDLSDQEHAPQPVPPSEDISEALDRLRTRIQEVAEWAEHASIPGGPAPEEPREEPREQFQLEAPRDDSATEPDTEAGPHRASDSAVLSFLRDLVAAGSITSGVYASDGAVIGLEPPDCAGDIPVSRMLALLDLVPPQTVLEVRTTSADWRAARIGGEAFALELRAGNDGEVDRWLATLLSPEKD
jgi:hypothetical protein